MNTSLAKSPTKHRLLFAPYHLYTHAKEFKCLAARMAERGWDADFLLPFTAPTTIDAMADEARGISPNATIHDFSCRSLIREGSGALQRIGRAAALGIYFIRATALMLMQRPRGLILTSDLGGVSIRFVQMLAERLGVPIFVLQTTLFLRQHEREDLKFRFHPNWLHRLLDRGAFKRLFLYFGEIPGTFLPSSWLAVQNDEIARVCAEFGKPSDNIEVVGSYQAALISEHKSRRQIPKVPIRGKILLLSECVAERFGFSLAMEHLEWMARWIDARETNVDIVFRFHPRETQDYRDAVTQYLSSRIQFDTITDPAASAAQADVVVGAFSMLLFDAQSAGIRVVFLDVGCDPIGFYSARRAPLADSAEALKIAIDEALEAEPPIPEQIQSPSAWADKLMAWINSRVEAQGHKIRH